MYGKRGEGWIVLNRLDFVLFLLRFDECDRKLCVSSYEKQFDAICIKVISPQTSNISSDEMNLPLTGRRPKFKTLNLKIR